MYNLPDSLKSNKSIDELLVGRENNFDFIRFIAAVAVIFSHSFDILAFQKEPLRTFSDGRYTIGDLSVAVFFIISGLLITQSFQRSSNFRSFVLARVLRIYPALIVIVVLTVFLIGPFLTTLSLNEYFSSRLTYTYLINALAIRMNYFLPGVFLENHYANAVNGSLWTLPLEIGCYALVASIGLFLKRRYIIALSILLAVYAIIRWNLIHANTYYFMIGALVFVFRTTIKTNIILACLFFLVLIVNLHFTSSVHLSYLITGISLSYLIIHIGFVKTTHIKNFTKNGDFSYGLYIWAFIVQQSIASFYPTMNFYLYFIIAVIVTLCFAFASWYLIERPSLKLKKMLIDKRQIVKGFAFSVSK